MHESFGHITLGNTPGVVVFGQPPRTGRELGPHKAGGHRCSSAGLTGLLAAQQPTQQPKFPFKITTAVSLFTENTPQPLFSNAVNVSKLVFFRLGAI